MAEKKIDKLLLLPFRLYIIPHVFGFVVIILVKVFMVEFNRSYTVCMCVVSNRPILIHQLFNISFKCSCQASCISEIHLVLLIVEIGENDWDWLWKSNFNAFLLVVKFSTSNVLHYLQYRRLCSYNEDLCMTEQKKDVNQRFDITYY